MPRSERNNKRRDQVRGRKPKHDPAEDVELPRDIINKAVEAFKKGKTVIYPTDTVYGLGCDATNYDAVEKVLKIKDRNRSKSLIVLVDSFQMLESIIEEVPEMAWQVLKVNKKPLTIVYDRPKNIAENVVAADDSLAVRVTNDPFCRAMIRKLRRPIVSTSANLSGGTAPVAFSDLDESLTSEVDLVLDLPLAHKSRTPSSIMKIGTNGEIKIIRK